MPTEAEEAFAGGFADLASVHGQTWTFGAASFLGVSSALKPDDPRMQGGSDRLIEVLALTSSMPSPLPARGDELTRAGRIFRVTRRPDTDLSTGLTTLVVSEA